MKSMIVPTDSFLKPIHVMMLNQHTLPGLQKSQDRFFLPCALVVL